ncbi:DUF4190 domain-containing protein [Actinomycetota bacterium]|nr:DUF4190 domain-containing protein [Actinomycetota bacterium]
MSEQVPHKRPAGWYPDPDGKPADRYWNGSAWVADQQTSGAPKNGMGVAALVLGIIGLVLPIVFFVFSTLALLFGFLGLGLVSRGEATNKGMATAGVVLGGIGLVISALLALFYLFLASWVDVV